MTRPFIRLGDKTDHGGVVTTASTNWHIYGKPVAHVGDLVSCPKCKGVFPIIEGASDMGISEKQIARQGDRTACGARLIASQTMAGWDGDSGSGEGASDPAALIQKQEGESHTLCLSCLAKAAATGESVVVRG